MKRELKSFTSQYDRAMRTGREGTQLLDHSWLDSLLKVDLEVILQDEQIVMMDGGQAGMAAQARGQWLLSDPRLQHWLTVDETKGLLVDGNGNGSEKVSPMSHVCALLNTALQRVEPVFSISFFCGLHIGEHDPLSGPAGLVRCLIRQILDFQHYDLGFIDVDYERRLQEWDIAYLVHLFQSLVDQLPQDCVLFCVIDGISFYEKSLHNPELETVLQGLTELTQDCGIGPIIKLLITSPLNNRCAAQYFSQDDRLTVLASGGYSGPLTPAQVLGFADSMKMTKTRTAWDVHGMSVEMGSSDEEGDYLQGNFNAIESEIK